MRVSRVRNYFLIASALAASFVCDGAAGEAATPAQDMRHFLPKAFLERYCFQCHDNDSSKAGLSLEDLSFNLAQRPTALKLEAVFDKLADGQMPPKKADQPSAEERAAVIKSLGVALYEVSQARQQTQGRTLLRRLNRTQYEDTLRDLLALPALEVKDLLPEE